LVAMSHACVGMLGDGPVMLGAMSHACVGMLGFIASEGGSRFVMPRSVDMQPLPSSLALRFFFDGSTPPACPRKRGTWHPSSCLIH
jgi:hypothetical protein